ncbi:MAG: hypothetical protein ACK52I_31805 [Pseudomonadota bacterium]|jgi:hypothetical protein
MDRHIREFAEFCAAVAGVKTMVFVKATAFEANALARAMLANGFPYRSLKHWIKESGHKDAEVVDMDIPDIEFKKGPNNSGVFALSRAF